MKTASLLNHEITTGILCAGTFLLLASAASAQNLYVGVGSADIYSIAPNGTQTLIANGMNYPIGMAFDSQGNLFVANSELNGGAGNISKIAPGGAVTVFAANVDPQVVAFNSAGNLFEAEYNSGNIMEYTPSGTPSTFATGFGNPIALAFNSTGDLFVGSGYGNGNGIITEVTPGGAKSTFATGLNFPTGLAFNAVGDLFACNNDNGTIYEYTPGGVRSTFATLSVSGIEELAFDSTGQLYATTGDTIIKINSNGTSSTFATLPGVGDGLAFQGLALPVPEPSTLALLGVGASAVALRLRRKK